MAAGGDSVPSVPSSCGVVVDNPYPQEWRHTASFATRSDKIVCVLVGLPARGKSYIARRLAQYVSFFYSTPCKVFNVAHYLRRLTGQDMHPASEEAEPHRVQANEEALSDVCEWMEEALRPKPKKRKSEPGGDANAASGSPTSSHGTCDTGGPYVAGEFEFGALAVYDGVNGTVERRQWVIEKLKATGAKIIFIEISCDDEGAVIRNLLAERMARGEPDPSEEEKRRLLAKFMARIAHFEKTYEPMTEKELSWIKVARGSSNEMTMHNIRGFLPSRIAQFLMNLNLERQPFYFTRHGQSEYNHLGKLGGDSDLTEMGEEYATELAKWVDKNVKVAADGSPQPARLWTSSLRRTIRTARRITHEKIVLPNGTEWVQMRPKRWRQLDELYAGICDGMTYEEVKIHYPNEAAARKADKFEYRYPRGESYTDLISRLEPMAHEMERMQQPLVVVAHQAILRVLYCYLMERPRESCPEATIPLNTVIKLIPTAVGCKEERFDVIPKRPGVELDPASH